jgi:trehalose-6-phosphate synthase
VAEIAWITPLRDGMNLVAKEYIAVQGQKNTSKGVLILSEFAGAAVELHHAVLTNPYDARSLKEGLLYALRIKNEEREMRMKRLYEKIEFYDINFWAEEFLQKLSSARGETPGADREDPENHLVLDKINIREF